MNRIMEITWDKLADIYKEETGGSARTQPMEKIFDWAVSRKDLFIKTESGGLSLVSKQKTLI